MNVGNIKDIEIVNTEPMNVAIMAKLDTLRATAKVPNTSMHLHITMSGKKSVGLEKRRLVNPIASSVASIGAVMINGYDSMLLNTMSKTRELDKIPSGRFSVT
mmetsp:Transcript_37045/g.71805  ORF Transcript_37045/g.71805 Transcript_37045/m.71805 type:complete len:103 (+) Transcript_37045:418-726(+)